jgi:hypothetical protein
MGAGAPRFLGQLDTTHLLHSGTSEAEFWSDAEPDG